MHNFQTLLFVLDVCFFTDFNVNKDYPSTKLELSTGCAKREGPAQCQMLCQKNQICTRFSYMTEKYNGVQGSTIKNCCFLKKTVVESPVALSGAISGPQTCPVGKIMISLYLRKSVSRDKCITKRSKFKSITMKSGKIQSKLNRFIFEIFSIK